MHTVIGLFVWKWYSLPGHVQGKSEMAEEPFILIALIVAFPLVGCVNTALAVLLSLALAFKSQR